MNNIDVIMKWFLETTLLNFSGYEFLNKSHFTIFKVEKATEFHCLEHYLNKLLKSFNY